jgi:hypothetical protein
MSSRHPPPLGLGAWWTSWAVAAVVVTPGSSLLACFLFTRFLRRLDDELH